MIPRRRGLRGLTLLEAVLAMSIATILLIAVGMALVAGSGSIKANQDFAKATRVAQSALQSMSTAARTAFMCDVESGAAPDSATSPSNVLYVTRFNSSGGKGIKVAYIYDAAQQMLLLDTTPPDPPITATALAGIRSRLGGTDPTVFPLARQISSADFTGYYDQRNTNEYGDTENRLVSVKIQLVVSSATHALEMSESVVPRSSHQQ